MQKSKEPLHNEALRKRLGQYFTNELLADLLVAITEMPKQSISIDPMAGSGNMLAALIKSGYMTNNIYGIEIDPVASEICNNRINKQNMLIGDAFDKNTYHNIETRSWDLVITNPPYVRYQSMSGEKSTEIDLPTAKQVRENLLDTIEIFTHLDTQDKKLYKHLVQSYSGLSDIAVPAWILCAAMVKPGGKLAMVVPNTWLNREYAVIVQYMLLKWFDIEYIIEDVDCAWFSDALVKTELIIATRIQRRLSVTEASNKIYTSLKISSSAVGSNNLVEYSLGKEPITLSQFLDFIKSKEQYANIHCSFRKEKLQGMISNVLLGASKTKWFDKIEKVSAKKGIVYQNIPSSIATVLRIKESKCNMLFLEDVGVHVGQGLRTGANKFFYLQLSEQVDSMEYLIADKQFTYSLLQVPQNYTRPVLQKQSDLPDGFLVDSSAITGRVLYIQNAATNSDLKLANEDTRQDYEALNTDLEDYINEAQVNPIKNGSNTGKYIPSLSAVKTNQRVIMENGKRVSRFWYMLPTLVERHTPDLCVARINYKAPMFYMFAKRSIVVDANFSTLWIDESKLQSKYAYFALLNSYWFRGCLEAIATVMGGGALKVEAVHIKKVPIPELTVDDYKRLNEYGEKLAKWKTTQIDSKAFEQVDRLLLQRICKKDDVEYELEHLMEFVESHTKERKRYSTEV